MLGEIKRLDLEEEGGCRFAVVHRSSASHFASANPHKSQWLHVNTDSLISI